MRNVGLSLGQALSFREQMFLAGYMRSVGYRRKIQSTGDKVSYFFPTAEEGDKAVEVLMEGIMKLDIRKKKKNGIKTIDKPAS
jgi:hypothetical protein